MTAWYKEPDYTGNGIRKQIDKSKLAKEEKDDTGGKMLAGAAGLGAGLLLPGLLGGAGATAPAAASAGTSAASSGLGTVGGKAPDLVSSDTGKSLTSPVPKPPSNTGMSKFTPPSFPSDADRGLASGGGIMQSRKALLKAVTKLEKWVGPALETANQTGISEGLKPTGKKLGGTVNRITEPVAGGIDTAVKYSPIGVGGNINRMVTNPRSMLPKGMGKKMEKSDNIDALIRQQNAAAKAGRKLEAANLAEKVARLRSKEFNTPKVQGEIATNKAWREGGRQNKFGKINNSLPTDADTMATKSLIKSLDHLIKGIDRIAPDNDTYNTWNKINEAKKRGKHINPNSKEYRDSHSDKYANQRIKKELDDDDMEGHQGDIGSGDAYIEGSNLRGGQPLGHSRKAPKRLGSDEQWGKGSFDEDRPSPKVGASPDDYGISLSRKSLAKSIDKFLMRKGILQKTANKSSLPLGTYQKAGEPVKRMVNNSAKLQSPDVWSAGKKTTKVVDMVKEFTTKKNPILRNRESLADKEAWRSGEKYKHPQNQQFRRKNKQQTQDIVQGKIDPEGAPDIIVGDAHRY